MSEPTPIRVVCVKPIVGRDVLPGCKGVLVSLGKLEATVLWDGQTLPMIINKNHIAEDKLAGHIVE